MQGPRKQCWREKAGGRGSSAEPMAPAAQRGHGRPQPGPVVAAASALRGGQAMELVERGWLEGLPGMAVPTDREGSDLGAGVSIPADVSNMAGRRQGVQRTAFYLDFSPSLPAMVWRGRETRPPACRREGQGHGPVRHSLAQGLHPVRKQPESLAPGSSTRTVDRAALPGQLACKKESEHQEHDYLRRLGHCPAQPPTPLDRPVL